MSALGMHALSGCDTSSYPYGKGKISALNTLLAQDFPGLADVLGEVGTTQADLIEAAKPFTVSSASRDYDGVCLLQTFHQEEEESQSYGPTSNICQPVAACAASSSANYVVESIGPPDESADITHFGWEIRDGIPIPVIAQGDPAPPELINVIQCQCRAQGKKCSTEACGCHKQHLSCTSFCNCSGDESCCNPYTMQEDAQPGDEGEVAAEDFDADILVNAEEEDFEGEGVESVNAEENFEEEEDILDDDWLVPDNVS